jgi:hypothetical protein
MTESDRLLAIERLQEQLTHNVGTKCEVFSRVVGYHRPVENWNDSKQAEFHDRHMYEVN